MQGFLSCALALACAGLLGCAQDRKFEGVSVSLNSKDNRAPYIYSAVGSLDFDGQDPALKARKVMVDACPLGLPSLMVADAPKFTTATSNQGLLVALFTCNQRIPGVE